MIRQFLSVTMFVLVAVMFGYNVNSFFVNHRDPFVYISVRTETPEVRRGGTLRLIYEFERIRFCETFLTRFIVNSDDESVVWRDRVPGGSTGLGRQRVVNTLKLPDGIDPGRYVFRLFPASQCQDGLHQIQSPDIAFRVVE